MSDSFPPRSWQEIRSALADYSGIIAFVFWAVSGLLWLSGMIPSWLGLILAGVAGAFTVTGVVGQVFIGGGQPLTSLEGLEPSPQLSGKPKKFRPQSNLIFSGIEYLNLYLDNDDIFWEMRREMTRQVQPSYSVVLRFSNEPLAGRPGQPIRGLRAQLTFRDAKTGQKFPPVDRALWVREKYNAITLEVGDSKLVLIGFGLPVTHTNPAFVFTVSNTHHEGNPNGVNIVHKIDSQRLEVDVRLVAGNAGQVVYRGSLELITTPRLMLSEKPTNDRNDN